LSGVSLRIPDSPFAFEDINLKASLENGRVQLETLNARSGGGVITGGGEIVPERKGSRVWLQGKNIAANYPEGLRSQIDFDLKIAATETGPLLSGDIQVLRSLYEDDLTFKNPLLRKLLRTTAELNEENRLKNRMQLDLKIRTIQDLRLKNNLAIVRAGADLKLEGTLQKPRLLGRMTIRPGSRIYLLGNQYDFEKATLEFFGSDLIEPNLDITISSLLRDFQTDNYYEVFLPFGGTLSNLEFKNVRSNPSLSQDQIFSLVAEGTVESDQTGSSSGIFQRQILTFFAGQALGAPGQTIAKSIGLSRIQIQQEGLSSVNDPKTRLMLGKDIGAGFSLIYSFALNDPEEQTWIATYRYGRNVVGRFIDQDDGTYTVSVSHKIPFGPGMKQTAVPSGFFRNKERGPKIESIVWKNTSPLTDQQVQDFLKSEIGDDYDYWELQDRVDHLKQKLQKMNYLFPFVDVREKEVGKELVSLTIEVDAGSLSTMTITGHEVSGKLRSKYEQMWRTGISAAVTQQMIQEDLLEEMQYQGFYEATVEAQTTDTDARKMYTFLATPGTKYSSVHLDFRGAAQYRAEDLQKDLIRVFPSSAALFHEAIHKSDDFTEKIRLLYVQKGYLRTEIQPGSVEYDSGSGKIVRTILIEEGPVSRVAEILPSEQMLHSDVLQQQLNLHAGEIFQPGHLLEDEVKIRDYMELQGYQKVSVRYSMDFVKDSSDLAIRWDVQAGPIARVASINIQGNQTTRSDLILNLADLKQGDVLTPYNRALARKRISDLGVFQQVGLDIEETGEPGLYDVSIHVVENKKYEFQYGGRYNTDDQFGAEIRLSDYNLFGKAHNLNLYVRSTLELPLFRVDYTLPVTGSFWDRTRFSVFRDETDEDVRATIDGDLVKIPFEKRQLTAQFQQDHRLWQVSRLLWSIEYSSLTADFQDLDTRVPIQFEGTEALLRGALVTDRRDDPLNAQRGYFFSIDGEFAPSVGTDISYMKNFSQFFFYRKIGRIVSASGVRAGFLGIRSNILTISEKFRTGGSTTVRGFEQNTVVPDEDLVSIFFGGDSVLILNQEIRFPIYKWFTGAVFLDAGNVYLNASDFDPTDLRYSSGFGIRAGAAGFILRLDFGFNLSPEEDESRTVFHFGIGQAF
jgi:outer membrane protein insertion porin family